MDCENHALVRGLRSIIRIACACFRVLSVTKRSIAASYVVGGVWSRLQHHISTNARACGLGHVEHTARLRSLDGLLSVEGDRISSKLFDGSDGTGGLESVSS
ncbi:hypothetical protein MNBD_ACTINO02-2701 [hydrothermal vent metagenome]|uniref:Uncharacterized protein n=1 Tax=hydrothermal vent metagenome TaxID=652676 RepID=A0A3B0SM72_9ZZZZ